MIINRILRLSLVVLALVLIFSLNLLFALAIFSMSIVPLTWIYAFVMGQSYSYTIDQSDILYKLNKFGQWSFVIGLTVALYTFLIVIFL